MPHYEAEKDRGPHGLPPGQGIFAGGIASGLIAGCASLAFAMCYGAVSGAGFWSPLRFHAGALWGVEALIGGAGTLLSGLCLYLVVKAFLGVVFASLLRRDATAAGAMWGGLFFGAAVWLIAGNLFLPTLDRVLAPRVALQPGAWFVEHMIYGVCLLVTPALKRRYAEASRERRLRRQETIGV